MNSDHYWGTIEREGEERREATHEEALIPVTRSKRIAFGRPGVRSPFSHIESNGAEKP